MGTPPAPQQPACFLISQPTDGEIQRENEERAAQIVVRLQQTREMVRSAGNAPVRRFRHII